ncbi:PadR family transcriptional regulator [Microbacterium pseudoresistens]|uniref:DNA-binding PadR family transcriptional regulator n=1 Tax=Microbacterium pseudoresistens TaxID=640634 RepID=A0A7Y9ET68_9MICO|nr:helix-turn-helix transcriptional regulator [Microbacterium pseudoresistens]NYD53502.1 DNA-binding PadR family transcriptional regulator [Microbacterium pseudoresistens]
MIQDEFETHLQELRRGTVVLASLQLLRTPGYGYGLLEQLAAAGFPTDANTLYPLLRRLEKQGFLESEWNTDEARPRKFYRTSAAGIRLADTLTHEVAAIAAATSDLTGTEH